VHDLRSRPSKNQSEAHGDARTVPQPSGGYVVISGNVPNQRNIASHFATKRGIGGNFRKRPQPEEHCIALTLAIINTGIASLVGPSCIADTLKPIAGKRLVLAGLDQQIARFGSISESMQRAEGDSR